MTTPAPPAPTSPPLTLGDPAVQACPFATYARLREEAPVYLDPLTHMFVVTRFDDVRNIAADPETFSNDTRQLQNRDTPARAEILRLQTEAEFLPVNTLVTNDPPSHRQYRGIVDKAFQVTRIQSIEPRIREVAESLIDAFPSEPFDFVDAFAIRLPMQMIAEQLGVPPEMGQTFKIWSDATLEAANFNIAPDRQIDCTKLQIEMLQFFADRGAALRKSPDDTLISAISNARIDDRLLTRAELVGILLQVLVAGNETTTNALATGAFHLASDTKLQDLLRAAPSRIPAFCEEILRLHAPLQGLFRRTTRPTTLGDVDLPEGAILNIRWGAANRDPAQFPHPDEIDLDRPNSTQHLAFGFGIHYCIGNQLARAEMQLGFSRLLARSQCISLPLGETGVEHQAHFIAHGIRKLIIQVAKAT